MSEDGKIPVVPLNEAQVACYVHHHVIEFLGSFLEELEKVQKAKRSTEIDRADAKACAEFARHMVTTLRATNNALLMADSRQVVEAGELHHDARKPVSIFRVPGTRLPGEGR